MLFRTTTAHLTLMVSPQLLENQFTITIDPQAQQSDLEAGRLPGKVLSAEITSAKSISTTGKETVGDKATGEVTLFNDTDVSKTLDSGTTITAANELAFTLDDQVQIASKSVDLASDQPFKAGTAKSKVTAKAIGAEYNLPANTSFAVANFSQSSLLAKNEAAFSGGSSREVQAVSQADQDQLLSELQAELETKALEKLNQQIPEGFQLINSSVSTQVADQKFDHQVGDTADALSLNLTLKFTAIAYSQTEFDQLVKQQLASRVPMDKQLSDVISTDFKLQDDQTEGVYRFDVVSKSYLLPQLKPENIQAKIKGKRPEAVKDYLFSLPSVSQVKTVINPQLPSFLNFITRFPFDPAKIQIEIVPEEK